MLPTRGFNLKDINRLKVKVWKNIFHTNENQKRSRGSYLVSDKTDFQSKPVTRDKRVIM